MTELPVQSAASLADLRERGFAILRGAMPAEAMAAIDRDLDARFRAAPFCEGGFYGERTKRFGRLLLRAPGTAGLVMHPEIIAAAEDALLPWCERIQLNLTQAIELHPGALAQFPHRDQEMWQGVTGEVEYLVNVMWPLTSFNDERTAKRISDALGTATELRAMKNYAGHRLSPWLGHLMVSRTETARALLTPGEVMQLPPADEIVMVAGLAPIRARKARYFKDRRLAGRVLTPAGAGRAEPVADDWSSLPPVPVPPRYVRKADAADAVNGGIRQEPELPVHEDIVPAAEPARSEFDFGEDGAQADAARNRQAADRAMRRTARAASLDPDDGIDL